MRKLLSLVIVLSLSVFTIAAALEPKGSPDDCSSWTLDGYRLGMADREILSVRPATIQVAGQGQVVVPGRFSGVVVVDPARGLVKWEVLYQKTTATELRAAMRAQHGEPVSDVLGEVSLEDNPTMHQRRTTWTSAGCDVVIIVYERSTSTSNRSRTGSATLVRASSLPKGFTEMKGLTP